VKKLWLAGEYIKGKLPNIVWSFIGIFDTKRKAKASCYNLYCFIAPIKLNETSPEETIEFTNVEYPLKKEIK
jgi:hypothetical protein